MRPLRSAALLLACAATFIGLAAPAARADTRLTAQYRISIAGISIGRGDLAAEIGDARYSASGAGRAAGVLRILLSGEGTVTARGRLVDGLAVPERFGAVLADEDERSTVNLAFDNGVVTDIVAESSAPRANRVPVRDEHRRGVIDPVSAMFIPGAVATFGADTCRHTLPIFDGTRRYDLALSFKRVDKAKSAAGYQGPIVVCAVAFRPIAGHRPDSALVKYISGGRDLELWLAPIAGTPTLGPYRLSVANLIGDLVIEAVRYEAAPAPAAASAEAAGTPAP